MRFYIFACVSLIVLVSDRVHGGRVENGFDADPDDTFAFRVLSIENDVTVLANVSTGVAISEYFGLVAAQAIHGFQLWYIGLGSINTDEHVIQRIDSTNVNIHPEYDSTTLIHNIAVIKFNTAVKRYLPITNTRATFYMLHIFGYGYTDTSVGPANTLQQVPVLMLSACSPIYPDYDPDNSFCGVLPVQSAIGDGDQGGPVTDTERTVVYGIVSLWGTSDNDPAVIIDIAAYQQFIQQVIDSTT